MRSQGDNELGDETNAFEAFEAFDESIGIGLVRDPYPVFHEMMAEGPVLLGPQWYRLGMEKLEAALIGKATPAIVMPFDDVQDVLKNSETYSNSVYAETNGRIMGRTMIVMDDPEHRRHRALVQQAFTPKAMTRWEPEIVEPILAELLDAIADRGRADLVRDVFMPFPIRVISAILGLPSEDLPVFQRKAVELLAILTDVPTALAASQWLYDYFAGLMEKRRASPEDDMITQLTQVELDGQKLTDDEIVAFLRQLLPAGAETTYRALGNLMFGLLAHPDQLDAVRSDRSLVRQAVEEGLRWETPLTEISRTAASETQCDGVTIPAGAHVRVCLGSANHDPSRWEEPDQFDIFREQHNHTTFGIGPHICLGMHLARMEMRAAVEAILDRLPGVRLDPDAEDVHVSGLGFRSPRHLPVLFDG